MTTIDSGSAALKTIDNLRGPAGKLEALLNTGTPDASYTALVCHPHPLGGGTMHNKVVYHTMKALQSFGLPVLRFNFRGTGLSEGAHDDGRGEQDDVRSALDWLEQEFHRPVILAGFSFGAAMGLRAGCGSQHVEGIISLGLPVHAEGRDYHYRFLASCTQPKLFISGTRDQFAPREQLEPELLSAIQPSQIVWIDDAEHFFVGKLDEMQSAIRNWVQANFIPAKVS